MMDFIRLVAKNIFVALTLIMFSLHILFVLVRYYLFSIVVGCDNALLDATDLMRGWRGLLGMLARRQVLHLILGKAFGNHITIYSTLLSKQAISIGNNVYIGFDCNLGNVQIGCNVLISDGVSIMSGGHQHGTTNNDRAFRDQPGKYQRVLIGDGAWIGAGAIIMANIGKGSIVGAGSVVTKPVPDGHIVAGVPARYISTNSTEIAP